MGVELGYDALPDHHELDVPYPDGRGSIDTLF